VWTADFAVFQIPKALAGVLVGATAAGQLDVALRIPMAAAGAAVPILPPLIPAASHFTALGAKEALVALSERAMRYLAVIVFPTFAAVFTFGPQAVVIWVGSVGTGLGSPVRLLAIALLANTLPGVATSVALGVGRADLVFRYKAVLVLSTSFLVPALSHWGLTGIAIAMAVGFVLSLIYMGVAVAAILGPDGRARLARVTGLACASTLAAAGVAVAWALTVHPLSVALSAAGAVTLGGATYATLVVKARLLTRDDLRMLSRRAPIHPRRATSGTRA
jgi:O-antigen/teichoic acid export membrane protein